LPEYLIRDPVVIVSAASAPMGGFMDELDSPTAP